MQVRSGPRKLPNAPVIWDEVWWWCSEIQKRWGYWMHVSIHPPIGDESKERFRITVEGRKMRYDDPTRDSTVVRWRKVEDKKLTAEQVALTLVVEIHRHLDNEELERERSSLVAGAIF